MFDRSPDIAVAAANVVDIAAAVAALDKVDKDADVVVDIVAGVKVLGMTGSRSVTVASR